MIENDATAAPRARCGTPALAVLLLLAGAHATGASDAGKPPAQDKFRQLDELLPTPNTLRTASGAPGHEYWQQRADYVIDAELDAAEHKLSGRQTITYHNRSPDALAYLWLQLDANLLARDAASRTTATAPDFEQFGYEQLQTLLFEEKYGSDLAITEVTDGAGAALDRTIVGTMMRIDLPEPLAAGASFAFNVAWNYVLNPCKEVPARTCYEPFEQDQDALYAVAQWYPRMAVYGDTTGWQHQQFLGRGEFALEFGDFLVRLTVPANHVVSATGVLQNPQEVLTAGQRQRLEQAATAQKPLFIVTPDEARANASRKPGRAAGRKTWTFEAENVRDFAFASSRRFIWDAMGAPGHLHEGRPVLAMSFYPPEAEPLWSRYSTHAAIHALDVYSRATLEYPWPVVQSVHAYDLSMEYPMLAFSGIRPEKDGSYDREMKYDLLSLIFHEVGHNYFPMIINTDERQWSWMDEGLNTFVTFLAESAWERGFRPEFVDLQETLDYMSGEGQVPIMTGSESIELFDGNAYNKPLVALNVLREAVLGPPAFDHAFRTYAQRWKFKRPYPADFFRTMEDASGVDLDWFWRGWFYTNDHVDVSIDSVRLYTLDTRDPAIEKPRAQKQRNEGEDRRRLFHQPDPSRPTRVESIPGLKDFYDDFDEATVLPSERKAFEELLAELRAEDIDPALLRTERYFYAVELKNIGGLVTPLLFHIGYTDGSTAELRVPAEIWRLGGETVTKLLLTTKEIQSLELDRDGRTADVDMSNNAWPRRAEQRRFQLFKEPKTPNPMQELKERR